MTKDLSSRPCWATGNHGKSVEGVWTIRLADLPAGVTMSDVDDVFLLLNCEYVQ